MATNYRADIDGLRALAIVLVILFHGFPGFISGGFIGVDIFFVISGFLITNILAQDLISDKFNLRNFYARRILRIFPALVCILILSIAIAWLIFVADEFKIFGSHLSGAAIFISNFIYWNEVGYFDSAAELKPLLHLWSLAIEEQFYIFWPLILWVSYRAKISLLLVTVILFITSFCLGLHELYIKQNLIAAFYAPWTRFWELLAGSLLALILPMQVKMPLAKIQSNWCVQSILSIIGLGLIMLSAFSFNTGNPFPGWRAFIPVLGAVLLIMAGPCALINQRILSNRFLVWLGLISYPLYLWHWPVLSFLRITSVGEPSNLLKVIALMLSIVLAYLTYRFIEKPIRFGGKKYFPLILIACLAVLGLLGQLIISNEGFSNRSINLNNLAVNAALKYDWKTAFRHQQCFLDAENSRSNSFDVTCSAVKDQTVPTVVLWGDSHAASLYQGLLENSKRYDFNLIQFTSSGCPPVLNFSISKRPECIKINNQVLSDLRRIKPDFLIMSAYWSMYGADPIGGWETLPQQKLQNTITELQRLGIQHIVMIGSLPVYSVKQVQMLKKSYAWQHIQTQTFDNFLPQAIAYNNIVKAVANETQTQFIDPLKILCSEKGCMLSLSDEPLVPLSYDYGHLTTEGSIYLVSQFFKQNLLSITRYK